MPKPRLGRLHVHALSHQLGRVGPPQVMERGPLKPDLSQAGSQYLWLRFE